MQSLVTPEQYVHDRIEQIASDRAASERFDRGPSSPLVIGMFRRRIGAVLIGLGERVGGPADRAPQPPAPLPTHTPLLGF